MGIQEWIQLVILPVHSQSILSQVVCTDREEIAVFCQVIGNQYCRRRLYHDSNFYRSRWYSFLFQFFTALIHQLPGRNQFPHADYHREHHCKVAIGRSPEKGSQLSFEKVLPCQADPDSPESHGRVGFLVKIHVSHLFICTDITGSDYNFPWSQSLKDFFISVELLFF